MQINSISTTNNATSFGRVYFHNKKDLVKLSTEVIDNLVNTSAVKEFSKRKDFDLHITTNTKEKIFKYKIKSVGRGLYGFITNFIAPWKRFYTTALNKIDCEEYIDIWHPSKAAYKNAKAQEKIDTNARKIRLQKIQTEEKLKEKENLNLLTKVEKQDI